MAVEAEEITPTQPVTTGQASPSPPGLVNTEENMDELVLSPTAQPTPVDDQLMKSENVKQIPIVEDEKKTPANLSVDVTEDSEALRAPVLSTPSNLAQSRRDSLALAAEGDAKLSPEELGKEVALLTAKVGRLETVVETYFSFCCSASTENGAIKSPATGPKLEEGLESASGTHAELLEQMGALRKKYRKLMKLLKVFRTLASGQANFNFMDEDVVNFAISHPNFNSPYFKHLERNGDTMDIHADNARSSIKSVQMNNFANATTNGSSNKLVRP